MKKLSFVLNILLAGIILFQACKHNTAKENKTADNTSSVSDDKFDCNDSCNLRFCKSYSIDRIEGKLDGDMIKTLSESYSNDDGKGYINGRKDETDALSVVFDNEKIKTLIWTMENKACANRCDPSTQLGIRFYYIKYPNDLPRTDHGLGGLLQEDRNKHSLVMVPVYKPAGSEFWYDYDLTAASVKECFPKDTTTTTHLVFGILPGGDNHGGIGPPPAPGTFPTNNPASQH